MRRGTKKKGNGFSKNKKANSKFDVNILTKAKSISDNYQIIIRKGGEFGYIGCSLEIPTMYIDETTANKCYEATREALKLTVAAMLECGITPPPAFSPKKRTQQVNIRLNSEEKLQLTQMSRQFGFKGLSDFIRMCALERIYSTNLTTV